MSVAVLCVDDEPEIATAYRIFLGPAYDVTTVDGGEAALAALAERGPFAVVVADLHMPGMDGIRLLATVRERYPDTVRVLATGHPDLNNAIQAVNDGHVFRFLTKPISPAALVTAVTAAADQYRLILSDRRRAAAELQASEERYRRLFEANPHPMWVFSPDDYRFLAVNDAAVIHYGFTRDQFRRMTIADLEPVSLPFPCDPADVAPIPGRKGQLRSHRLAAGGVRQMDLAAHPIEFDGRPSVLVLAIDVTEQKVLEEQLKQAQKLESIGQLAAGIAHEINTPIQYIGDNTTFLGDALRDLSGVVAAFRSAADPTVAVQAGETAARAADLDYLLEEIPRALDQTLDGVRQVARIVKAMKEFAHPGSVEKSSVDLNKALETVITVARNEWKYVAEVRTDLDPHLPPIRGLPGELNQVFLNLLVNAAHAMTPADGTAGGKGGITIVTRKQGNVVEVRVTDNGCGIPEHIRGRVFDPFFTTKPVGKGTGQGLTIAHAVVVKKHDGVITFESEPGVGTTFIVRLPIDGSGLTRSERVPATAAVRIPPAAGVTL